MGYISAVYLKYKEILTDKFFKLSYNVNKLMYKIENSKMLNKNEIIIDQDELKFLFKKIKKFTQPTWIEIWNIETNISSLENNKDLSWNLYLKYKLSMVNSWHILEERFLIFFLIFLICFF